MNREDRLHLDHVILRHTEDPIFDLKLGVNSIKYLLDVDSSIFSLVNFNESFRIVVKA